MPELDGTTLDAACVAMLRSLNPDAGSDWLLELVRLYASNAEELLTSAARALAANDRVALRSAAHALKSSSGNLGARRVSALCAALELAAADAAKPRLEELLRSLQQEQHSALDALRQELERAA